MWVDYAARQAVAQIGAALRLPSLRMAVRSGRLEFPAAGHTVISLTSHGTRLSTVHHTLASLLIGTRCVPTILWLDAEDFDAPWPEPLRELVERGLHVRRSDGHYGPHTKYYGTFRQLAGAGISVITVDDDVLYPRWFVEKLVVDPLAVTAYRAHEIALAGEGFAPYTQWRSVRTTAPSPRHFATGVSGVAYPPAMVDFVAARGDAFLRAAPSADDVWLNMCAVRSGHYVRQVFDKPKEFPLVPGSQSVALVRKNLRGGNDAQLAASYSAEDIRAVVGAR